MNRPSTVLPLPEVYYDHQRKQFYVQDKQGDWIIFSQCDVERYLRDIGYSIKRSGSENSEVHDCILNIQREQNIAYAGSLAGYSKGCYEIQGNRILVTTSPKLIVPQPGDCPLLRRLFDGLLIDGATDQRPYVFGWLKVAVDSLYSGELRPGQALVLAGVRDCGKSLLQNLITIMLGGRSAKPYQFMTDRTAFNADLFEAEHLMIEDEPASKDIRARRAFGNTIKQITAADVQRCHAKNRQALSLTPFWRITVSVNSEPENLMVLPPLDESIEDKLIIIKAMKVPMPMPTTTPAQRKEFWNRLIQELPAFVHHLQTMEIPETLRHGRFGVIHFHHPELVAAINSESPEEILLALIDARCFDEGDAVWTGTAEVLTARLTDQSAKSSRTANQLLSHPSTCGHYLGRLRTRYPHRFSQGRDRNARVWTIHAPDHLQPREGQG